MLQLIVSWLVLGLSVSIAGWLGWLSPLLSLLLIGPLVLLVRVAKDIFCRSWLAAVLGTIWLIHLLGVGVPETGFDAVWYHLPIVKAFVAMGKVTYLPEYYQSLNPLFSDLLFLLGYQLGGEGGAKVVAWLLAASLAAVTYHLARIFLTKDWALATTVLVSTFQVVSWQASSFYVDVAKAFWEVSCLWLLVRIHRHPRAVAPLSWYVIAGACWGAALATKLFTVVLWPVMLVLVLLLVQQQRLAKMAVFSGSALVVALPFYLYAWYFSGQAFFAIHFVSQNVEAISGQASLWGVIQQRTWSLWFSPLQLTLSRDYITPLLGVGLVAILSQWRLIISHKAYVALMAFAVAQWLLWWYIPPLSTRYGLSGFIILTLLSMCAALEWAQHSYYKLQLVGWLVTTAVVLNLIPRLYVSQRSLHYVFGNQTKTEYLQQFMDGNVDTPLKQWHQL